MTQTGLSLGTPQYMSPEQAMGERTIDARSDIYALGAVTYEMLAGDAPFTGSSVQAIVAKVISERPTPLHTVRDTVPDHIENAVLRALAKLPADRFATADEFASALMTDTGASVRTVWHSPERESTQWRRSIILAWTVAAVALLAAAWGWLRPAGNAAPVTRLAVELPSTQELLPQWRGFSIALSGDGTRLAYVGEGPTPNSTQLWIRPLDALQATAVPNTIGASTVRWAPGGNSLLFSSPQTGDGGASILLDGSNGVTLRASYDGDIVASGRVYNSGGGVITRQVAGGLIDTVAHIDARDPLSLTVFADEKAALLALPRDSNGVFAEARIVAVSLATGKSTLVGPGIFAKYLPSGHLLYVLSTGDAFVAPFDARNFRTTGPGRLLARVALSSNSGRLYPQITVSDNGTLAYLSGDLQRHSLTWLDANGKISERLAIEGNFWGIALSPDGGRVAISSRRDDRAVGGRSSGTGDVWVEDLRTRTRTQLTSTDLNVRPSWSADGASVLYTRIGGPLDQALFERRSDASEPERLVASKKSLGHSVGDGRWLPDHRTLVVRTYAEGINARDIYYTVPGSLDTTAHPVAATPADETAPTPSPDGTLIAYNSTETGTMEVYVQRFPSGLTRLQVSRGGGGTPRWSKDGQLYYWDQRKRLMVASIQSRPSLAVIKVRDIGAEVAAAVLAGGSTNGFDVGPDGRILIAEPASHAFSLVVVRNWMAAIQEIHQVQ